MADCALVEVPGGTFRMGGTLENVRVRRFALDANEVTVGRFRRFWANRPAALASVRASPVVFPGGQSIPWRLNAAPPGTGAGCNWSMSPTTTDRERHPMNCVDWTLAMEFCVWDGGRLPTEAEWEFVAQGWVTAGLQAGRPLPWGTHDPTQEDITAMMMPDPDGGLLCPYAQWVPCPGADGRRTRRVGLGVLGAPAGVFDLGGNVAEWTASDVADLEAMCWTERRENPLCTNTGTELRNHRGGAYDAVMMSELRNTMRGGLFANQSAPTVGFRCARTR
jgi:formylglycine-generating enzyme required for sulfatase activity